MKPVKSVAFATWMLEHLALGAHRKSLSGDLLEELRNGRSASWYRRQVVSAIAVGFLEKTRASALPMAFSVFWSTLYPLCALFCVKLRLVQIVPQRWAAIDWPYSSALQGIGAILPALLFVWLGLFVYRILRTDVAPRFARIRLLAALSISLNVFLLVTIAVWIHLKPSAIDSVYTTGRGLRFDSPLTAICIPVALSLFAAIASVFPSSRPSGSASLPT